jgi:hypothetical protein
MFFEINHLSTNKTKRFTVHFNDNSIMVIYIMVHIIYSMIINNMQLNTIKT